METSLVPSSKRIHNSSLEERRGKERKMKEGKDYYLPAEGKERYDRVSVYINI